MAYLLVLLSVVGLAVQFALTKLWQQRMGTGLRTGLVFNGLVALLSAAVLFAVNGASGRNSPGFPACWPSGWELPAGLIHCWASRSSNAAACRYIPFS